MVIYREVFANLIEISVPVIAALGDPTTDRIFGALNHRHATPHHATTCTNIRRERRMDKAGRSQSNATVKSRPDAAEMAKDVSQSVRVSVTVNGHARTIMVEPRTTLLDALREELALTGTKKGCDRGECGACTVHVEGRRILSCMTLAVMQEGKRITTIEGLEQDGKLHPVQAAFIEHDAFQCGFCTSGQIMSGMAMIEEAKAGWPSATTVDVTKVFAIADLSTTEIRERMSGNLCRCACYPNIVDAVADAMGRS
jgi:xanthine dehydrogenase YagT iron-sulfur-binding subunit